MDRGTVRNMYEFYSKNKIERLVHLDDFIVRISVVISPLTESPVFVLDFES